MYKISLVHKPLLEIYGRMHTRTAKQSASVWLREAIELFMGQCTYMHTYDTCATLACWVKT